MYQEFRSFIRIVFFKNLNWLIKYRFLLNLFICLFERLPYKLVIVFVRNIKLPNINFDWTIRLYNKRKVVTRIYKDNPKTWHFAVGYKWHDPALNRLEVILDDYYSKDVPWIDIGANLGLRSLTALSSHRPVYLFEPNNELNELNRERCEMNKFYNYQILPFGISDTNSEMIFNIDSTSYMSSFNEGVLDDKEIIRKEVVQVKTLDKFFEKEIDNFSSACIKIDVEGHEKNVLSGAENFINKLSPTLIIEINEKGDYINSIIKSFLNKGYKVFEIYFKSDNKYFYKMPDNVNVPEHNFNSFNFLFVKDDILIKKIDKFSY